MSTSFTDDAIDISLLSGLDPAMSKEEQAKVTAMLISGDTNELAKAAEVLYQVGNLLKQGVVDPSGRTEQQSTMVQNSMSHRVYKPSSKKKNRPGFNDYEEKVANLKIQSDIERIEGSKGLPLPVRMPRYVVIDTFDPDVLKPKPSLLFVDDEWDGAVGAAFTKLTVKKFDGPIKRLANRQNIRVHKELKEAPGYDKIVNASYAACCDNSTSDGYKTRLLPDDVPSEPISVIIDTKNDASKLGLHQGDVITHINGEEFTGGTVDDLKYLLKSLHASSDIEKFEIVVNAEQCIAEALKLRSRA